MKNQFGEKNNRAKLTWWRVRLLRAYYERNKEPYKNAIRDEGPVYTSTYEIANRLGMSQSSIWYMLTGKTWPDKGRNS